MGEILVFVMMSLDDRPSVRRVTQVPLSHGWNPRFWREIAQARTRVFLARRCVGSVLLTQRFSKTGKNFEGNQKHKQSIFLCRLTRKRKEKKISRRRVSDAQRETENTRKQAKCQ